MSLVSKQCVDFVKSFEGFSATPYRDCVGVKTLGYGMTRSEIEGISSVTEVQASQMLENLLDNSYAVPIKKDLDSRGIHLNQNQFDALVSMAYNVGVGSVLGSTLYKNICAGVRDVTTITTDFCMWDKAGGNIVQGLLRRRQAEAKMFFSSGNSSPASNVSSFTPNGSIRQLQALINAKVDGKPGKETLGKCPLLKCGSTGNVVKWLQYVLNSLCHARLKIDGDFEGATEKALINYQGYYKLAMDGECGQETWKKILHLS